MKLFIENSQTFGQNVKIKETKLIQNEIIRELDILKNLKNFSDETTQKFSDFLKDFAYFEDQKSKLAGNLQSYWTTTEQEFNRAKRETSENSETFSENFNLEFLRFTNRLHAELEGVSKEIENLKTENSRIFQTNFQNLKNVENSQNDFSEKINVQSASVKSSVEDTQSKMGEVTNAIDQLEQMVLVVQYDSKFL